MSIKVTSLPDAEPRPRNVAIGTFDGVHLGHQAVIEGADTVLTFDPHPLEVLHPAATRALIRVEETVSPSTSTSGTTRVSNSERASSIAGSPCALAPKRKFSPTETCLASSFSSSTRSMKSSAPR